MSKSAAARLQEAVEAVDAHLGTIPTPDERAETARRMGRAYFVALSHLMGRPAAAEVIYRLADELAIEPQP